MIEQPGEQGQSAGGHELGGGASAVTPRDYKLDMLRMTKRFMDEFGGVIVDGFPAPTPINPLPVGPPFMPGRPKKTGSTTRRSRTSGMTDRGML